MLASVSSILLLYLSAVLSLPDPSPQVNGTSLNLSLSSPGAVRVGQGTTPNPPPGFKTQIKYINTRTLNPLSVYLTAIGYTYAHHVLPWTTGMHQEQPYTTPEHDIAINVILGPFRPGVPALEIGHVMLALFAGVAKMSEHRFNTMLIDILISSSLIGHIMISRAGIISLPSSTNDTNVSTNPSSSSSSIVDIIPTLAANTGRYIDPLNPTITIPYSFSPPPLPSKDIFTAILDALIIIAHDGTHTPFTSLTAFSASGNTVLHLNGVGDKRPESGTLATVLCVVSRFFVRRRGFESLEFGLELVKQGGEGGYWRVAEGWFLGMREGVGGGVVGRIR
ncbi:MAG: hypothetical protein Q9220_003774 [cf. Caloplaca sp. 1 TL-2023]